MARPIEFDRETVLEQVMLAFWQYGFAATSIADLQAASGLGRQSLYNGFGDKQQLYLLALEHYQQQLIVALSAPLTDPAHVPTAFRQIFAAVVGDALANAGRGCLLVNAGAELAAHSVAVREVVISAETQIENAFTDAIRLGQQKGQISANQNPRKLAIYLYNSIIGLRIRSRYTTSRLTLQSIADASLQIFST